MNNKEFFDGIQYKIIEGHMMPEQSDHITEFLLKTPEIINVLEIGFNAGIGAACFLNAREDIRVTSIDIGHNKCVPHAKEYIDKHFPGRHILIIGDSTEKIHKINLSDINLFFIDGGHTHPIPEQDIYNCHKYSNSGDYMIIDDWCPLHGTGGVNQAIQKALNKGILEVLDKQNMRNAGGHTRGWGIFKCLK